MSPIFKRSTPARHPPLSGLRMAAVSGASTAPCFHRTSSFKLNVHRLTLPPPRLRPWPIQAPSSKRRIPYRLPAAVCVSPYGLSCSTVVPLAIHRRPELRWCYLYRRSVLLSSGLRWTGTGSPGDVYRPISELYCPEIFKGAHPLPLSP